MQFLLVLSVLALISTASAAVVNASFDAATTVPITATSYTATGNTVNFTLTFAPPAGTNLTVVNNTGLAFIQGAFDNLTQGQAVSLTYGGVTYPFVANYFGGSGNDLILQWANSRLLAWGSNSNGELGNNSPTNSDSRLAVPVVMSGLLAGKSVIRLAEGDSHSLILCSDGTLAGWGYDVTGQLGNGATNSTKVPVLVDQTGVLAGKTIAAIASGSSHGLALCSDGNLAAWGSNTYGQLGNGGSGVSTSPVLVTRTGVLAGKTIRAIAGGGNHSLALCMDGTLAAWGWNAWGQLGIGSTTDSKVPVAADLTGVLAGKTLTAVAAGASDSLALCSDGTLAAWGNNTWGQLGNNSTTYSKVPVLVVKTGVLAGKTVTAIASGAQHCLALCSDGTLVAWGYNNNGQLGNNTTNSSSVPVLVTQTGILAGKTIQAIAAGTSNSHALCTDGTLAAWGNSTQLGNNSSTQSSVPVWVTTTMLGTGERFTAVASGASQSIALVASPSMPMATTMAATPILDVGATLHASVNAQGSSTSVSFEYGLTSTYGTTLTATPATVSGSSTTTASATVSGLLSGTTYHYRVVATNPGGAARGNDMTFTTTTMADLSSLTLGTTSLYPAFTGINKNYSATVSNATSAIAVTPVCANLSSGIKVNGITVASGATSGSISLAVGNNVITTVVTSAGGANVTSYVVTVCRLPATFAFNAATDVPVTANDCLPAGNIAAFALNYAPIPGTNLMVVKNTGPNPIQGTFDNLAQGQSVTLTYNGVAYSFVANYSGGTGNDLVLQWKNTRLLAWGGGYTYYGQLGNGSSASSPLPVPVDTSGVLAGKTVIAIASGPSHSLALCADGTLATWGYNYYGQLGNRSTNSSSLPVLVDRTGVLAGKTVVRIAAGNNDCLVLCSDGTLAAWGDNWDGALGNNSTISSSVPVLVDMSGVLAGKSVSAIAAGNHTCLALCADGNIATWGWNDYGQLGNNNIISSSVPVLVDRTGVLAGKTVTTIASENTHNLALCSDGTVAAWGYNNYGQLGNNSTTNSNVPVAVTKTGVLAAKTVLAIAVGDSHSLALCADGSLAAWGYNNYGQLGNNNITNSSVPVLVTQTGVLAGKTVVGAIAGDSHSIALCADGTLAAWGYNVYGQLGNNSTSNSSVPVTVSQSNLGVGERAMSFGAGAGQSVALFAEPPPPVVVTQSASGILDSATILNGTVNAQGTATAVSFEYGITSAYGTSVAANPASVSGTTTTAVAATISGLSSGTTYHYRVVAAGSSIVRGSDMTFTTTTLAALSGLSLSDGTLSPTFATGIMNYLVTVPFTSATLTLTPQVTTPGATVTIGATPVASGNASTPIDLTTGENRFDVKVTAADASTAQTYTVTVTRLPQSFVFNSASDIPLTVGNFSASGNTANITLNFAPLPGTNLMAVRNSGNSAIQGVFSNLTQGQAVSLTYNGVTYPFVADYANGSGNDLVLRWGNTKLMTWGNGSSVAVPVSTTGAIAGRTASAIFSGPMSSNTFAVCLDGATVGWGTNSYGSLGNGNGNATSTPVLVNQSGVLAGKTITTLCGGMYHTVALCSDGTLATWGGGSTDYGQLGNNTSSSSVPVLVDRTGVLAGKTVVAVAAGYYHCLVLCSDGSMAAWGSNGTGPLGNGTTADSKVPVAVNQSGVLAGKTVVAIACGSAHNLALCNDGSIAAWGYNFAGQLGNSSSTNSSVPVLVNQAGALAGKNVHTVVAGDSHSLALCSDGTVVAWGNNGNGQLGNNSNTSSSVPVLVSQTGVLATKTVVAIAAGQYHSIALCSGGTTATWGWNNTGQLGNNSLTNSSVPVLVGTGGPGGGECFTAVTAGSSQCVAVLAMPPPPVATTVAATAVNDASATMNASVNPNGSTTNVSFEYGLTPSYGSSVTATPASLTGSATAAANATISGLLPGTVYHFRALASSAYGTSKGEDMTFTTSSFSALADLVLSNGTLDPVFVRSRAGYLATVPFATDNLVVTPIAAEGTPTVTVNGLSVPVGTPSNPLPLSPGENVIRVGVTAQDGKMSRTYTVTVTRLPASFVFNSPTDVPVSVGDFTGVGNTASIALNFAPTPGTILTMINDTGGLIRSPFSNLAQGQLLPLTYNGITYSFVANYYGGSGNDLVLQWANTRVLAWGSNAKGQLGNGTTTSSTVPVAIDASGILAGESVIGLASGMTGASEDGHSLALCADGTVAAWGTGSTLGNNSTTNSSVPVWVDRTGVLAGKTVAAVSVGSGFNLALCSDGTLAGWGYNSYGQLGNNSSTNTQVPVAVLMSGVLAGKTVVALAAGNSHGLALCADGTLAAWGYNASGQLGNNSKVNSSVAVLVDQTGVLAGKKVVAISAGDSSNLVLCSDGTLAAWGYNGYGQLGNNSTTNSLVPVLVDRSGVLASKTVVKIASGNWHNLALCSDGTLTAWGNNGWGALGNSNLVSSPVPVWVDQTGVLAGKTVVAISAARIGSLAVCSDGTLATWGQNTYGQLGNNSKTDSNVPVRVNTSALRNGERFMLGISGSTSGDHTLALVASPLPTAVTQPAMILTHTDVTLNGSVNANGNATTVSFEYGLDATYGNSAAAIPAAVSGSSNTQVSLNLGGLLANTTYHFRVLATCNGSVVRGADMTFIPSNPPVFAGYAISTPFQTAASVALKKLLAKASDPEGSACSVTLAGPASANGGTAVLQASGILYTPPAGFTGSDTFLVTITDASGASTSGTVTATVGPAATAGGATSNPPQITVLDGGQIGLKFQGIPGRSYQIQRSQDLATWATIATVNADSRGAMTFTDATPPQPNAYYRLALP